MAVFINQGTEAKEFYYSGIFKYYIESAQIDTNIVLSTVNARQPVGGLYWFDESQVDYLTNDLISQAIYVSAVFEDISNE